MAKAAKKTAPRAKKAPRSVPAGGYKVPQHVEKAAFVVPTVRGRKARSGRGKPTFLGFRRENGRVGVRNHVVILPLDDVLLGPGHVAWRLIEKLKEDPAQAIELNEEQILVVALQI